MVWKKHYYLVDFNKFLAFQTIIFFEILSSNIYEESNLLTIRKYALRIVNRTSVLFREMISPPESKWNSYLDSLNSMQNSDRAGEHKLVLREYRIQVGYQVDLFKDQLAPFYALKGRIALTISLKMLEGSYYTFCLKEQRLITPFCGAVYMILTKG